MTFTINEITRCAGTNHWDFTVTVNSQTRTFQLEKADLDREPGDLTKAGLTRVRSALLEAGATTWAEARTALIGKEFKV